MTASVTLPDNRWARELAAIVMRPYVDAGLETSVTSAYEHRCVKLVSALMILSSEYSQPT